VADPRSPEFAEIISVVRLKATSAVRPEDRRSLNDALAILKAWRATYRLTGTIPVVDGWDSGKAEGLFHLVRLDTGTTVWTAELSVDGGGFDALRARLADSIARYVCKIPEKLRVGVDETYSIADATITWRATWDLEFKQLKGYAGGLSVATYQSTATQVSFWKIAYGGTCTGSASWPGGTISDPQGLVNLRYRRGVDARSYSLNLPWIGPKVPMTVTCVGSGAEGSAGTKTSRTVTHWARGELKSSELDYKRFPIHEKKSDAPAATWTVYDMTSIR
jgi:hypothetical protein